MATKQPAPRARPQRRRLSSRGRPPRSRAHPPRPATAAAAGRLPSRRWSCPRPGWSRCEQRARPIPGPGEVLIRPAAVGLCGTDLDILAGRIDPAYVRYPLVLGHEWSGTVLASGSGSVPPGTRMVAEGIVPCGHCAACRAGQTNLCATYDEMGFTRDGAAAGYAVVGETLVHPLAPAVSMADGALVEPASVVYRGLASITVRPGSRALVVGDGTVALLAAALLGLWSPAEVVMLGRRPAQAALAATAGAAQFGIEPIRPAAVTTWWSRRPGPPAPCHRAGCGPAGRHRPAARPAPHGATAAVPVDDLVNNDLTIRASFGYTSEAWRDVVRLLNAGRLELGFLVTHRFPLGEWAAALDALRDPDPNPAAKSSSPWTDAAPLVPGPGSSPTRPSAYTSPQALAAVRDQPIGVVQRRHRLITNGCG